MKKFIFSVIAVLLMAATLFGVAALAEGEGGQSDPLVTLSYIDKVFTNYILDLFQDELDKKTAELEAGLNTKISEIEKAYGASGAVVERSTYSVISLADGQTLVCQRGAEIMLRVGSAVVAADDSPGLVDTSTTENLDNGKALTKNHMYMVTINDHGVKARGSVKVLVRGDYVIK